MGVTGSVIQVSTMEASTLRHVANRRQPDLKGGRLILVKSQAAVGPHTGNL